MINLYLKNCIYNYCLNENRNKLPTDVILNLIDHYYQDLKNYYKLLNIDFKKANKPKYLNKTDKYSLYYYSHSFKIVKNKIRLTVGKFMADNYNKYHNNLYKINSKLYCFKNDIQTEIKKSKNKKFINKFFIKTDYEYINKKKTIDANYIYLKLPKKIKTKNIKLIQIQPYGNKLFININYEYENIKLTYPKMTTNNSISIDTGIINLMIVYNPTDSQYIIKSKIKTINEFYNKKKIAELKSINKKNYNLNSFNRLYSLLKLYPTKKYFIIGYNDNWKNKINLGHTTNRIF